MSPFTGGGCEHPISLIKNMPLASNSGKSSILKTPMKNMCPSGYTIHCQCPLYLRLHIWLDLYQQLQLTYLISSWTDKNWSIGTIMKTPLPVILVACVIIIFVQRMYLLSILLYVCNGTEISHNLNAPPVIDSEIEDEYDK